MNAELETLNTYTPLGIRFWDPAFEQRVGAGLAVCAYRAAGSVRRHAKRTPADIYYFDALPGLRRLEHQPFGERPPSPAAVHEFVVEVRDTQARFLPIAFAVALPLPYTGLLLSADPGSPGDSWSGLHLYAASTREVASSHLRLYAELVDETTGRAAAHALIEVRFADGSVATGISDGGGRVAVVAPLPQLEGGLAGSPGLESRGRPLSEQTWDVAVVVRYQPSVQESLPGTDLPDYASLFTQGYATFAPTGSPQDLGDPGSMFAQVVFATPLILRNGDGSPGIFVSPAPSTP